MCRGDSDHQERPDQAASRSENPRPSDPISCCFPRLGEKDHPPRNISRWQIISSRCSERFGEAGICAHWLSPPPLGK